MNSMESAGLSFRIVGYGVVLVGISMFIAGGIFLIIKNSLNFNLIVFGPSTAILGMLVVLAGKFIGGGNKFKKAQGAPLEFIVLGALASLVLVVAVGFFIAGGGINGYDVSNLTLEKMNDEICLNFCEGEGYRGRIEVVVADTSLKLGRGLDKCVCWNSTGTYIYNYPNLTLREHIGA